MGFVLALLLAVVFAFFAWANLGNSIDFQIVPAGFFDWLFYGDGYKAVAVPVWALILGSAVASAVISWLCSLKGSRFLRKQLRAKELEIGETRDRLRHVEKSLQDYEGRIHEFTLKVLELSRAPEAASALEGEISVATPQALSEGEKSTE
ncbi:MAG: hypothetical protein COZ05_22690 [Armatimonadetes bacterium CG_4_10_14_3_um_filter_59_10]|nr:MAG: hypothetical protein COZ05_22690 [Armatimonadetes bacterium CG_4_10_14_3_um_filter_59_10]